MHDSGLVDPKWWAQTKADGLRWEGFVELPGKGANVSQMAVVIEPGEESITGSTAEKGETGVNAEAEAEAGTDEAAASVA